MNLFSYFLRQDLDLADFEQFITYWDRLERVMVQVYRKKCSLAEASPEFEQVWPWLQQHYDRWQATLEPFWRQTKAAGQPTQTDPFQLLLAKKTVQDIPGDWSAMQHLPAAREAINRYLRSQINNTQTSS